MKFSVNSLIQICALVAQGVNLAYPVLPPGKAQIYAAVSLSAIQGIVGVLAHFANPDGSSAKVAYQPESAKVQ